MKTWYYVKINEAIYNCIKRKCNLFKTPFIVVYALGKFSHAILREYTSFYASTASNDYFKLFTMVRISLCVFCKLSFSEANKIEFHCHKQLMRHTTFYQVTV